MWLTADGLELSPPSGVTIPRSSPAGPLSSRRPRRQGRGQNQRLLPLPTPPRTSQAAPFESFLPRRSRAVSLNASVMRSLALGLLKGQATKLTLAAGSTGATPKQVICTADRSRGQDVDHDQR